MDRTNSVLLKIEELKTYFPIRTGIFKRTTGHIKAVDGINLAVYKNETLGIVGESGCGKTTLCKTIVKLYKPTDGKIEYITARGRMNIISKDNGIEKQIRKKIQYIFQDPQSSLNPAFTIIGSLRDAIKMNGISKKAEQRKIVGDLLEAVNMRREAMDLYPNEFSGGQRQRIGIARALCVSPELVICDEAVSALDVSIQAQVLNLLKQLKTERDLTYIFVTHDLSVVEYISDRIAVMYLGKIVELGDTEDLLKNMLHPYTLALRSAVPVADIDIKKKRIVLDGDVPSPANPPSGCAFHPRCWKCIEKCKNEVPELKKYIINDKEYYVACHLVDDELSGQSNK